MRYRHVWPGLLLLSLMAVLLVSLALWGDQVLSPTPAGGISRVLAGWPLAAPDVPGSQTDARPVPWIGSLPSSEPSPPAAADGPRPGAAQPAPSQVEPAGSLSPRPSPDPGALETPAVRTAGDLPRYAIEIGAFLSPQDAERVEATLNRAGLSTVRFRHQSPGNLYGVFIEPVAAADAAWSIVTRLRGDGFPDAVVIAGRHGLSVRVAEPGPMRTAVQLAESLQARGYQVRVNSQLGRPSKITLRHGSFVSREEAGAASTEVSRLGVPNEIVRVK